MAHHEIRLAAGDMVLFWGGLPHRMDDASDDPIYAGGHLPLIHFFRLRLPEEIQHRLMAGATLVIRRPTPPTSHNFRALEPLHALGRSRARRSTPSTSCCCGWSACGSSPTSWCRA